MNEELFVSVKENILVFLVKQLMLSIEIKTPKRPMRSSYCDYRNIWDACPAELKHRKLGIEWNPKDSKLAAMAYDGSDFFTYDQIVIKVCEDNRLELPDDVISRLVSEQRVQELIERT